MAWESIQEYRDRHAKDEPMGKKIPKTSDFGSNQQPPPKDGRRFPTTEFLLGVIAVISLVIIFTAPKSPYTLTICVALASVALISLLIDVTMKKTGKEMGHIKGRVALYILLIAPLSFAFAAHEWPAVHITPESANYSAPFNDETYTFTISNDTEVDQYDVGVLFEVESQQVLVKNFGIELGTGSRKAISPNSRLADIYGVWVANDQGHLAGMYLRTNHLIPHERREIIVSKRISGVAKVVATLDYSTEKPKSWSANGGRLDFYVDVGRNLLVVADCGITFNADDPSKDKGVEGVQCH